MTKRLRVVLGASAESLGAEAFETCALEGCMRCPLSIKRKRGARRTCDEEDTRRDTARYAVYFRLWQPRYPFMSPGPVALRPCLATGLLLSHGCSVPLCDSASRLNIWKRVTAQVKCGAAKSSVKCGQSASACGALHPGFRRLARGEQIADFADGRRSCEHEALRDV